VLPYGHEGERQLVPIRLPPRSLKARAEKVIAASAGVLVTFLILEITLRLLGSQFQPLDAEQDSLQHVVADETKTVVLCVGDSVTYGIGAGRGEDYPSQLERRLNADHDDDPYVVINSGIAGANSAMIRTKLPTYLEATHPDVVTLLAGCANATNFFGYGTYVRRDTRTYKAMELVFRVRTFRMIRAFATKLRQPRVGTSAPILDGMEASIAAYLKWRESSGAGEALSSDFLSGVDWLRLGHYEDAIEDFDRGRQETPGDSANYWGLGVAHQGLRERDEAVEWFSECIRVDPVNPACYYGGGELFIESGRELYDARQWFEDGTSADPTFSGNYFGLGMVAMAFGPPGAEIDWLLECIDIDPDDARCYPNLVRSAEANEDAHKRIVKGVRKAAKNSQVARDSLRMLRSDVDRASINAWIKADLEAMVDEILQSGATLILQDYPVGVDENRLLAQIATERNLPLVEQQSSFASHYHWNNGVPDLFSMDRTHPNDDGYSLMAENLYVAIVQPGAASADAPRPALPSEETGIPGPATPDSP